MSRPLKKRAPPGKDVGDAPSDVAARSGCGCPVVGIGASAGGLEAVIALLEHLPARTGLAFALVQHLDPAHESHLSEILARATPMRVLQAENGTHVEPNHVYVIPPNASMSVADGSLHVGARGEGRARHFPIDHFFESLAAHRGNKAIGVVLSGSASDGSQGLRAIKAAGGITFAQTEDSAKFRGMPRSASETGIVDFVLPPGEIAGELTRLSAAPYVRADTEEMPAGSASKRIFQLLRRATGVEFSAYRQTTIQRRIQRRLAVRRISTMEEYLSVLESDATEVQALFEDILINVTSFFREPETFAALKADVFPALVGGARIDESVRVWLPGCSTGEEAYSLAMSLVEFMGENSERTRIQIFGTDVNESVIEAARKGIYSTALEADVSQERLRKFFTPKDGGYQINKSIREMCVFARQNVIKDPPFSNLDLISCRNLLIYFEPSAQKKLIPAFHYALKPGGFLLLGSAETINGFGGLFTATQQKHKIFKKRAASSEPPGSVHFGLEVPRYQRGEAQGDPPAKTAEVWSRLDVHKEADRVLLARFCPPAIVVDENLEIIQFRGEVAAYLNPAPGEASLNLFKMMQKEFAVELRSAIFGSRREGGASRKQLVHVVSQNQKRKVFLSVIQMEPPAVRERSFIILFEEAPANSAGSKSSPVLEAPTLDQEELATLREHVQALSEENEATIEELRAANEEIQSSNEELQSTNEELETAKEELQSTNEELTTLNEELLNNNSHLNELIDDLNNLLRGTNLAVVMLGRDLRIRRFTHEAQGLFRLVPTDVGRVITDIKAEIDIPDLAALANEVIDTLRTKELELRDQRGRWRMLQIRPFETVENKIAGTVLIVFDIDEAKRSAERLRYVGKYADAIVDTVTEPLLVLDGRLRVKKATAAFCRAFHMAVEETEGRLFYEIGEGQWDIPPLRTLMEEILPKDRRVRNFRVDRVFPSVGRRIMSLNASRVVSDAGDEPLIIVSFMELPA